MNEFQALQIIIAALIGSLASYIAYQQYKVNNDKLRLDLYNKRFDIYNKLIELFIKIPRDINQIGNEIPEELINSYKEFNELNHSFTQYYRESKFLFDEKSDINMIIAKIREKISWIDIEISMVFDKNSENLGDAIKIDNLHRINSINAVSKEIEKHMEELEKDLKPYLYFPSFYETDIKKLTKLLVEKLTGK